jgi:hypothetical protein
MVFFERQHQSFRLVTGIMTPSNEDETHRVKEDIHAQPFTWNSLAKVTLSETQVTFDPFHSNCIYGNQGRARPCRVGMDSGTGSRPACSEYLRRPLICHITDSSHVSLEAGVFVGFESDRRYLVLIGLVGVRTSAEELVRGGG